MKLNQIILTIFIVGLLGCERKNNEIIIKGAINGNVPDEIAYTLPINGVCNYAFKDRIHPDSSGNFEITVPIEEPSFVEIYMPGMANVTILAESGMTYEIQFDLDSEDKFNIICDNKKGQDAYNNLPNPGHIQMGIREFLKDTIVSDIKKKITERKESEIEIFINLLANGDISNDFFELVKLDRECYYSSISGTIALVKKVRDVRKKNGTFTPEIKDMWQKAFVESPPVMDTYFRSPWYYTYAKNYLNYLEYTNDSFQLNTITEFYNKGLIHTHYIAESKKHLPSKMLEYYNATYISTACFQEHFEKELITLFEDFKSDFPESKYTRFIKPLISPIVEFNKKKEEPFGPDIKFLEAYEHINSLSEALIPFRGKKVYIDVWGAFCGPCKAEFEYKSGLMKLLDSNDIEILYISVDRDDSDTQWKDMIKYYDLKGFHMRSNKVFYKNLREIFGSDGIFSVPWYLLIDENGEIMKRHASRPSQIKKLENEIK